MFTLGNSLKFKEKQTPYPLSTCASILIQRTQHCFIISNSYRIFIKFISSKAFEVECEMRLMCMSVNRDGLEAILRKWWHYGLSYALISKLWKLLRTLVTHIMCSTSSFLLIMCICFIGGIRTRKQIDNADPFDFVWKFILSSFWMDIFRKNGTVSVSQLCVVILRHLCLCSLNMHKLSNGEFDYCFRVDKQHTWLLFGILVHCRISQTFLLKCSISN